MHASSRRNSSLQCIMLYNMCRYVTTRETNLFTDTSSLVVCVCYHSRYGKKYHKLLMCLF